MVLREFKPKREERDDMEPHEIGALFEKGEFRKGLAQLITIVVLRKSID